MVHVVQNLAERCYAIDKGTIVNELGPERLESRDAVTEYLAVSVRRARASEPGFDPAGQENRAAMSASVMIPTVSPASVIITAL